MDLAQLAPMTDGQVATVTLPTSQRLRLAEMGLRPGAVLRVTQRAAFGGRVVALGAERFAVDAATCALIQVEAAR